jgi:hypothetical protein
LLVAATLASSGCLAVAVGGAAAGGAVGYAYLRGGLSQEFRAGLDDTWVATNAALGDLGMSVLAAGSKGETSAVVESQTGAGAKVHISLETRPSPIPAEGPLTRVSVRVGVFGDRPVSERVLAQIQGRLTPQAVVPLPPAGTVVVPAGGAFPQTAAPPLANP